MPEYKFELEMSEYFNTRAELMKSVTSPKLSDAKVNFGDSLAQVIFDQCPEPLREDFGLKVPLKGPGDSLWISPSDLLLGKIALKPPFTPKCLQALTHKGILEIGHVLEDKFLNEMEQDKQRALKKYKNELIDYVENCTKAAVKDVEIRERLKCEREQQEQEREFESTLKQELHKLETTIRSEYELRIKQNEAILQAKWEQKLQQEVNNTVHQMTKQYLAKLREQEDELTKKFEEELKKQVILRGIDAKLYKHKLNEALHNLKHNLECRNLVNMMYIICAERRKCCDQKEEIENHYQKKLEALEGEIKRKNELLNQITTEKNKRTTEVSIRESCLKEVIKHFQKFINFALRSAPTQAEFLLSLEKMMVFELTQEIAKAEIPKGMRPAPPILPWKHKETPALRSTPSGLEISDYHNCLQEVNVPVYERTGELGPSDVLPAIHYKNKLFVREDFRDMLSAGVHMSPSNDVWNKDIEKLVESWQEQIAPETGSDNQVKPIYESTSSLKRESINNWIEEDNNNKRKSAVQFIGTKNGAPKSARLSVDSKKISGSKSLLKYNVISLVEDITFLEPDNIIRAKSRILGARDSVDLIKEKIQKSSGGLEVEEPIQEEQSQGFEHEGSSKELAVQTKDSIIGRLAEITKVPSAKEFAANVHDSIELKEDKSSEPKKTSSKLSGVRNSVELLKESMQKLRQPSPICGKSDSKSMEGGTKFSGQCCEKCKRKEEDEMKSLSKDLDAESSERAVKISRIQIIKLDDPSISSVSFKTEPTVIKEPKKKQTSMTPKMPPTKKKKSVKVRRVPPSACKIIGDLLSKEGDQPSDEFTADRIHSLIKLIKYQPDLIRLFTAVTR